MGEAETTPLTRAELVAADRLWPTAVRRSREGVNFHRYTSIQDLMAAAYVVGARDCATAVAMMREREETP